MCTNNNNTVKLASYLDGHVCGNRSMKWSDEIKHTGSSEKHKVFSGSVGFILEEGKAGR